MLGAGDPIRAKKAASICILITLVSQVCSSGLILVLHNVWGKVYSNDPPVVDLVSRTLLFAAFLTIFDGLQGVCGGVLRGVGKQTVGATINLCGLYLVGLPTSLLLDFLTPLSFFGIWIGLITGVVVLTICDILCIFRFIDWEQASLIARRNAQVELADTDQVEMQALGDFEAWPTTTVDPGPNVDANTESSANGTHDGDEVGVPSPSANGHLLV